ncbi:MAG: hypothetical protein M1479_06865, partial [Actinobacteria bacterium]|nr:hypothetical protein [Actinomycetota bacterium]
MEKVIKFDIFKYELPLLKPLIIKNRQLSSRRGIIINIQTSSGLSSFGEIAPLPFFHKESLSQGIIQIKDLAKFIIDCKLYTDVSFNSENKNKLNDINFLNKKSSIKSINSKNINPFDFNFSLSSIYNFFANNNLNENIFPSVRFGIEMALLNLIFLRRDFKIILNKEVKNVLPVCKLCMTMESDIEKNIFQVINEGYKVIKIKVGKESLEQEIYKLKKIKRILINDKNNKNKIKIRLDSNGLWTLDEAVYFGNEIGAELIEYIEDPLNDLRLYENFFNKTGIPVAVDEKLNEFLKFYEMGKNITRNLNYLKAFILKPSLIGGFLKTAELIKIAQENNLMAVLSSSFESSIAISSIALFAFS